MNGALTLNSQLNIVKHLKKMLVIFFQLLIWELISLVYFSVLYSREWWNYCIEDIVSYYMGAIRWTLPTGHFWFIIALLSIYIILPIIKIAYDNNIKVLEFMTLGIVLLYYLPNDINLIQVFLNNKICNYVWIDFSMIQRYVPFNEYGGMLVYFICGAILHQKICNDKINKKSYKKVGIILGIVGWIYIYILKGLTTGFAGENYTALGNGYCCIGTLLLSMGCYIFIATLEIRKTILIKLSRIVGDNTLGIFYIHCLILGMVSYYIYPFIPQRGILVNSIKAFLVLFISLFITLLIKKIPIIKGIVL